MVGDEFGWGDRSGSDPAVDQASEPPLFSDDFTSDTRSEYAISQEIIDPYMGSDGSVSYSAANDWVYIHSPNNIRMILTRDDVPIPEQGRVRVDIEILRDYHRTVNFEVWLEESGADSLRWAAKGSAYENRIDLWADGERRMGRAESGTVDPNPGHTYTVDAYWTESSMSLYVDGEQRLAAEVDTTILHPTTFKLRNFQGDTRLKSIRVDRATAPHQEPPATEVQASATTLTLLPGYNENSGDPDGDELNSSIPDLPILDGSFIADGRTSLPEKLDDSIGAKRDGFQEYPGEEFKAYRLMNQIKLSFETEDGRTISDWSTAEIRINDVEDPLADDEDGGEWEPSYILVVGESEHGEDNPVRTLIDHPDYDWFNGKDKLRGDDRGWHDEGLDIDVNKVKVGDVEGIRASFIRGARDSFVVEMRRRFLDMVDGGLSTALLELGMSSEGYGGVIIGPPYFYTFIDLVVIADGSTFTRVWDASPYPKHYLYVGNDQVDQNEFEEGDEWNVNEHPFSNTRFDRTAIENDDSRTPFAPHNPRAYEDDFDNAPAPPGDRDELPTAYGPHPVMQKVRAGTRLTESDLLEDDTLIEPHFPWSSG